MDGPTVTITAAQAVHRQGILLMVGTMALFVVNDALVKFASQSMPSAQLIFVRGLFVIAWVVAVARLSGVALRIEHVMQPRVVARSLVDALAAFAYLLSLFRMPLGNATAIIMTAPLFITLLAVLVLNERVRVDRWLALIVGFGGAMLLVRPTPGSFDAFALMCLSSALLHAIRDLLTRGIPAEVSSLSVTLCTGIAVTALAAIATAATGWQPVGAFELGLLVAASLCLAAGYHMLILATRLAPLSVVAPFRYSGLVIALLLGWAVWGDMPDAVAWVGIVVLALAGLYLLRARGR